MDTVNVALYDLCKDLFENVVDIFWESKSSFSGEEALLLKRVDYARAYHLASVEMVNNIRYAACKVPKGFETSMLDDLLDRLADLYGKYLKLVLIENTLNYSEQSDNTL